MRLRIRKVEFVLSAVVFLLIFQNPLSELVGGTLSLMIGYLDEIIAVFAMFYILFRCITGHNVFRGRSGEVLMLCMVGSAFVVGLIKGMQPLYAMIMDAFLSLKFVFVLWAGELFFLKYGKERILIRKSFLFVFKGAIIILSALFFHELFFSPFFERGSYKYFMYTIKLMFTEPTFLVASCVAMMALFLYALKLDRKCVKYFGCLSLLIVGTLRAKGLALVVLAWFLFLLVIKTKTKNKALIIIFGVIVAFLIGFEQIEYYFLEGMSSTSRGIMLKDAIFIANKNAFGMGLASFGSFMSREYYSPVYVELGYNSIWGLSQSYPAFLCDNFFALVIGQFGWPGLIITIYYFKELYIRCNSKNKFKYSSLMTLLGYLVITAFGETSIFNSYAVMFAIIMALVTCEKE